MVLGLLGQENSGRKTFFKCLEEIFPHLTFNLFSPLDEAKIELNKFVQDNLGVSCYDRNNDETINKLIKIYYDAKNHVTKHTHWTKILEDRIRGSASQNNIPVVIDLHDYEWNIISKNNGYIIKVERLLRFRDIVEYPHDYLLRWSDSNDLNYLVDTVKLQLKPLLDQICPTY